MPFVSEQQRKYLYAKKPEVAKKFAEHSGRKGVALPSKISKPVTGRNK